MRNLSYIVGAISLIGVSTALAKPLSPRTEWRVAPIHVTASTNAPLIFSNMVAGVDSAFSVSSPNGWLSVEIPASTQSMMLVFAAPHALAASADESLDSTNGQNGVWTPLTPTFIRPLETATRQQRLDIDPGASRWIRLHLTNASGGNLSVTNIGLHEYDSNGNDDYWLFIGASIQQGSVRHSEFKRHVKERFGYDPVVFNEGVNGWTSSNLRSQINDILARHPRARYVAIHIGGNDVTNLRPYPAGSGSMFSNITTILQTIINSNMIPVPARLSFRAYNTDPVVDTFSNPLSETNGSGPYVTHVIDPLIQQHATNFYDSANNRGVVDMYTYFFNNQGEISGDGIHLTESGRQSWNRLWANLAGGVIYDDLVAPALSGAVTLNASNVVVTFSEDMDPPPRGTATNFTIDNGITVLTATPGPGDHQVTLLTSTMTNNLLYTLTVNNVMDLEANAITPSSTATFTYIDPAAAITVLFDLGSIDQLTTGNWNNVTSASTGMRITNAVASDGSATTMDFSTTDNFVANNSAGIVTNLLYPSTAQRDTLYVEAPGNSQAVIRISGLYTNILYDFSFFASRAAAAVTNRVGIYKIGAASVQMNAADNISNRVTLAAIVPDASGNVDITIQVAPGSTFAYLGVLEIASAGVNSGEDITPPQLVSAISTNANLVTVTFSEAVEATTAGTATNYAIDQSITVSSATPGPSANQVTLSVSTLSTNVLYTLTVNHVEDLAGNVLPPDSETTFTYINTDDVTPPELMVATAAGITNVVAAFSETLNAGTAGTVTNYSINMGITVLAATPGPGTNLVTLTTTPLSTGVVYTLTVNHVQDTAGNTIAPDSTTTFSYTAPPAPPTGAYVSILFDLGGVAAQTTGGWNNVTSTGSGSVTNAVDSLGNSTPIGYQTVTSFEGVNTAGVVNDSLYPATAQQDTFFLRAGTVFSQAIIRVTGLATNKTYEFLFFASRSTAGLRKTDYIIDGISVQLDAADNITNRVSISGITPPPSGNVDITARVAHGQEFGYLGVLEIREFLPGSDGDADTDGDGIPDWWELLHGGGATNMVATADDDLDGFSNLEEWIANTIPTNAASLFLLEAASITTQIGGGIVLQWSSAADRNYNLLSAANLHETMIGIVSNLPATPPLNSYTVPVNGVVSESFYGVQVFIP